MSPVPPPARSAVFTESWDDDSFDIDPNATLALASSPSSSSSSASPQPPSHRRKTSSLGHGHVQSPLRQSHLSLKTHPPEDDDLGFDLPDSFPALTSPRLAPTSRNTTATSMMSIRNLPAQVVGKGPTGVGTVTRLGGKAGPSVPSGTVLASARAIERAWENDVDFDSLEGEDMDEVPLGKRLSLSPPKKRIMPGPDALDEIDLDHDDEATLKAGATIKAMLPPRKKPMEDEIETDFVLPLNVKNLTLATASHHHPRLPRLPHSPSTSSGKKSGTFSWDDSPKRRSETSVTSLTDTSKLVKEKDADVFNEEEDMEDGLVIPSGTFFSSGRAKELNKILDRKRRAPAPPSHRRQGTDETFRTGDDSIEDGLVFDNPRADLSRKRLDRAVKARTPNSLLSKKALKGGAVREARERAWEKQREQGWGRHVPSQPLPGSAQRAQSSLGFTGRSQSSGATALKDLAIGPMKRLDTTPSQDSTISRARMHSMAMLPPPIPESRDTVPATPSSRLRHQKSHYHMPLQSPSLARKPSLASLQDAMSSGVLPPVPTVPQTLTKPPTPPEPPGRYHHSTSRLTMPTSSSRAKSRPPLQNVFPKTEFTASSSASSIASSSRDPMPRSKSGKGSWGRDQTIPSTMSVPRKARKWDGSELDGIEDIPVDGRGSGSFGRSKSRKALDMQAMGSKTFSEQINEAEKKRLAPRNKPRIGRRMPALISHKGRNDKVIVVGDMTFNPRTQRWEGNEALLRDFDPPTAPSVRPALITHYTGSSMGGVKSPTPGGAGTGTVRIVGNMMFDPEQMCWVSTLAPEDDEPDPFEGMADDEDEDAGGTITRATARRFIAIGSHVPSSTHSSTAGMKASQSSSVLSQQAWSSRMASESSLSAISWDDRIREEAVKIPEELVAECKEADERHKKEMRGWLVRGSGTEGDKRDRERREEKRLWEIRVLATT